MTFLSVPQYAKKHGVSKVAAYKWRERGWLVFADNGKDVDVEASDARLAQYRDPSDARADRKVKTPAAPTPVAPPPPPPDTAQLEEAQSRALAAIMATQSAPAMPSIAGQALTALVNTAPQIGALGGEAFREAIERAEMDGRTPEEAAAHVVALLAGNASTEEARRVKENYLALRGRLDYLHADGKLIEVEAAETVLFEEARAVRNAWLNFPAKYAAIIAADLGLDADRVTEVLTGYVHKQVNSLGEPNADFRR